MASNIFNGVSQQSPLSSFFTGVAETLGPIAGDELKHQDKLDEIRANRLDQIEVNKQLQEAETERQLRVQTGKFGEEASQKKAEQDFFLKALGGPDQGVANIPSPIQPGNQGAITSDAPAGGNINDSVPPIAGQGGPVAPQAPMGTPTAQGTPPSAVAQNITARTGPQLPAQGDRLPAPGPSSLPASANQPGVPSPMAAPQGDASGSPVPQMTPMPTSQSAPPAPTNVPEVTKSAEPGTAATIEPLSNVYTEDQKIPAPSPIATSLQYADHLGKQAAVAEASGMTKAASALKTLQETEYKRINIMAAANPGFAPVEKLMEEDKKSWAVPGKWSTTYDQPITEASARIFPQGEAIGHVAYSGALSTVAKGDPTLAAHIAYGLQKEYADMMAPQPTSPVKGVYQANGLGDTVVTKDGINPKAKFYKTEPERMRAASQLTSAVKDGVLPMEMIPEEGRDMILALSKKAQTNPQ